VPPVGSDVLRLEFYPDARHLADTLSVDQVALGGDDEARVIPVGEANNLKSQRSRRDGRRHNFQILPTLDQSTALDDTSFKSER